MNNEWIPAINNVQRVTKHTGSVVPLLGGTFNRLIVILNGRIMTPFYEWSTAGNEATGRKDLHLSNTPLQVSDELLIYYI
jgi:hypothetical protein